MTDPEPFGLTSAVCDGPSCQAMYSRYYSLYEQYIKQTHELKTTLDRMEVLSSTSEKEISHLKAQNKILQYMYERESAVVKALQGDFEKDRQWLPEKSTCPNCAGHRSALSTYRAVTSHEYTKLREAQDQIQQLIAQCKADVLTERLENGRLRAKAWRNDDLFWRNKEVLAARGERDVALERAMEMSGKVEALEAQMETLKQRFVTASQIIEALQTDLNTVRSERDALCGGRRLDELEAMHLKNELFGLQNDALRKRKVARVDEGE